MIAVTQISYLGPGARTAACRRCGRRLRDPVSVALGIGPHCRTIIPPPKEAAIMSIVPGTSETSVTPAAPAPIEPPVYMGWQTAAKMSPLQSLVDACDHYRQTRRRDARVILAAPTVAEAIAGEAWVRDQHLEIRGQAGIAAGMLYVGVA